LQQGLKGIPRIELLEYMRQAADGLTQLNSKLVHRDVKPENLLLFCGQVKVIDFGFARLAEAGPVTNSVVGTRVYAPPESTDRQELNPSVDIYCLAASFIRLATGKFAFGDGDDMMKRKREGRFHREGLLAHEITALEVALHPDPSQRAFASAAAFVEALRPPVAAPPVAAVKGTSTPATQVPPAAPSARFRDKLRAFLEHDDQRQTQAQRDELARVERLKHEFHELLDQQLTAREYVWANGTAEALLRWTPNDAELQAIRDRLQQVDPATGQRRCCDILGQRFVLIPPGEFWMGSPINIGANDEHPRHLVRITRPFFMSIYPVTVEQFRLFAAMAKFKNDEWTKPGIE
ncbi:MAG TPA: SUMF1/EgtB/PvdO family nonheme iron enzyme, partial [Pirellulaceae bacterium]|nr:SUMF1/EgtB/PvdO family nonheme iron enzyme [Pirellulaceae bacterium]